MMSALPNFDQPMTEADYLAFERQSEIKHHFIDGEIYAMSGASRYHNIVISNIISSLRPQIRGKSCEIYPSDMKVRTPATGSYTYPDVTIVCDEPNFDDKQADVLLNPTLLIEVLSPSTELFDRGLKFQRYREIDSLQEYILIAQDSPHIERFLRQENGQWLLSEVDELDASFELTSIGCTLKLAEVYEQVSFEAAADKPDES